MAHHHGEGDLLLAGPPELGPVTSDGRVEVDLTKLDQVGDAKAPLPWQGEIPERVNRC
jgi:hypothetical protein